MVSRLWCYFVILVRSGFVCILLDYFPGLVYIYVPVVVFGKLVLTFSMVYIDSVVRCMFDVFCYSRYFVSYSYFILCVVALSTKFI